MYTKKPFELDKAQSDEEGRRSIRRRHLIYYLRVWDLESGAVLGHIVDITTEGIMLFSDRPIDPGRTYHLAIRWNNAEGGEEKIQFQAESRWSRPDINDAFYDTGFRIIGGSMDVFVPILDLIDEYGFSD
jgi:hypothetical protein